MVVREENIEPADLHGMDGVFLSLSSTGIADVAFLNGKPQKRSPVAKRLSEAYWSTVKSDCA
jgi:branched-subunit amino acid aminotransferase/4-amino-4-deoxychorismate lyase